VFESWILKIILKCDFLTPAGSPLQPLQLPAQPAPMYLHRQDT